MCSSQSFHKWGEPQVKGSSRGAGPKNKCGAVEIINYDSACNMLSENLAHRIIIAWFQGPKGDLLERQCLWLMFWGKVDTAPSSLEKLSPGELLEIVKLSCNLLVPSL